ncbi:MAG TPA: hypothetical protein VEH56_06335 [Candidatus Saccharimonadales bacterium]|nr:hypothetical protein [Candidatus Saccharimonadales bacterium]
MSNSTPATDIVKEAQRIIDEAEKNHITLRLFGGLAVRFHCPSATHRSLSRKYADIDFMGLKKQARDMKKLFISLGYTPRDIFNALHGDTRLIFNDIENGRRIDIFLDVFEMCHKLDFKDRLMIDKYTIPLADLLATKLQVVEITEREYRDIISLIRDHEITETETPDAINGQYLAKLCAEDWGIYKTFMINLGNISTALAQYQLDKDGEEIVRKRVDDLKARIDNAPKSTRWKLRAKIGEKKQWYELPEKDKEVVDSRIAKDAS